MAYTHYLVIGLNLDLFLLSIKNMKTNEFRKQIEHFDPSIVNNKYCKCPNISTHTFIYIYTYRAVLT